MGTTLYSNSEAPAAGYGVCYTASLLGNWVTIADTLASADAAGVLVNPQTYSNSSYHPIIITQGSVVYLRARWPVASTLTTSPAIRLYGADQLPNLTTGAFPADTQFDRLDATTFGGTSTTITLSTAGQKSTTYYYTEVLPAGSSYSTKGAKALLLLTETAANISAGLVAAMVKVV